MIFDPLLGLFSVDMGIDLGTCNTLVCVRGQGIVLNEPSVVAVRKGTNQVPCRRRQRAAVGLVAKEMLGKTPGSITAIRPAERRRHRGLRHYGGDAQLLHPQGPAAAVDFRLASAGGHRGAHRASRPWRSGPC